MNYPFLTQKERDNETNLDYFGARYYASTQGPYTRGLATFVEFWIVRMGKWEDETRRDQRYLLVQFNLYERGLTDCEINAKTLKFTLRERRENEHTDCTGSVFTSSDSYETRPAKLSDYEGTKPGNLDEVPPLKSLPCLIADKPPVVIE